MEEEQLRPIGTIFTITYPPDKCSTHRYCSTRMTYEIVAHRLCAERLDSEKTELLEEIKPISIEEVYDEAERLSELIGVPVSIGG